MLILGLQFGHDASVTVVKDGRVLLCYEKERLNRVKHALGLEPDDIQLALADCGFKVEDVNYITLTSTQLVEYIHTDRSKMELSLEVMPEHRFPCTMTDKLKTDTSKMKTLASGWLDYVFREIPNHPYVTYFPYLKKYLSNPENLFGSFEHFVWLPLWEKVVKFEDISKTDYSKLFNSEEISQGFHYPAAVTLFGRKIPAYIFGHHYAHAAYAFFSSSYHDAAIISHDGAGGGVGYGSGMFYYGKDNRLFPITPHNLFAGNIYDEVGMKIGFDEAGAAGKLMGLSAYGKPRFYEPGWAANWYDLDKAAPSVWIDLCIEKAKRMGYDMAPFGKKDQILAPVNIDFAASTQKLIEEIMLRAASVFQDVFLNSGQKPTPNLCLTGGIALNCPANTRLFNESPFSAIHVPPAVGDMGLSIGSALALYHNVMGNPRAVPEAVGPELGYLGLRKHSTREAIAGAVEKFKDQLIVETCDLSFKKAAEDLAQNRVIGWFEGRSEVGPRALGHRSIISNPTIAENWKRVNKIKGREWWRPFAPAVLQEKITDYFFGTQMPSYYMLLNADVKVNNLPAITHADRSSRIQSVTKESGNFYHLLSEFDRLTGIPVVMNTSFNGPGEPIVETPEHAIQFLLKSELDVLYFDGYRLQRKAKS